MQENIIVIIQTAVITGAIGLVVSKLNKVLENQRKQEVIIAEIKKDVHSNQEWGKDSKSKIEDHEKRINELEKETTSHKEKLSAISDKITLLENK